MTTFGKISSSLVNYNSTTTAIDNPITVNASDPNGESQVTAQRNAPNLNLGSFQSTPYVLTPMNTNSTILDQTQMENYSFGSNITLVTPNVKASQPNHVVPSERVARYAGSFMDQARGMHGSIIIGHDIGTVGFPAGSDENTAGYDAARGYFSAPNIVMGSFILEGCGSQPAAAGYSAGRISGNSIIGNGFGSCVLNSNLDYYNAYENGYGYGAIARATGNSVLGHNNYANTLRPSTNRAAYVFENTIVGNNNGCSGRYESFYGYFIGYDKSPVITERVTNNQGVRSTFRLRTNSNKIIGNQNFNYSFTWRGTQATNPEFVPIVNEEDNVIIGDNNQQGQLNNYDYTGGDLSGYRAAEFRDNIVIGKYNKLKEVFETGGGYVQTTSNILIGRANQLHHENQKNIIMGTDWKFFAGFSQGALANGSRNILFGEPGFDKYYGPAGGTGASTSNYNVSIGFEINAAILGSALQHENVTLIGYQASASATNATNEITLGNSSISALRCNVTSITSLSDARDKANIEPISNASAFIKDLKPVKFDWNRRDGVKAKEHDIGFLAQDLDEAQSKHGIQEHLDIVYKSNPEALEASYGKLLPILVQALKEQQEEIEKLKSTN
jgi:hypothetical protein